ncbi:MAG: hypothetical protein ACI9R7_000420, partial [Lysobacterales bacterium]
SRVRARPFYAKPLKSRISGFHTANKNELVQFWIHFS